MELLENKGYITRKPSEKDKRVQCVYPTEQMIAVQQELKEAMEQWEETLLQDLSEEEKQQLNMLLARVRERVNKEA